MIDLNIENVDIYLTGKCNYKCSYCYGENDSRGSMGMNTYMKAIEFAKYIAAGTIQMCGGEPLVCADFEKYTSIARKNGFKVILRTNGIFVREHCNFIASNCEWVGISIDGMPYENALMRTPRVKMTAQEQFELPIEAICSLKKINPDIKIMLATLASKKNYKEIHRFAEYIFENKIPIDRWKIYEFIKDKFRSSQNDSDFCMTSDEFDYMAKTLDKYRDKNIILQSARSERVAGNCLLIYQNGDINIIGKHYGNVQTDSFDKIISRLKEDNALAVISNNKKITYGGIDNEKSL